MRWRCAGAVLACIFIVTGCAGGRDYFPKKAWADASNPEAAYEEHSNWYGAHLAAMAEPALWSPTLRARSPRAYRLLVLPFFDNPVTIRIEQRRRGGGRLRFAKLSGYGGYETGALDTAREMELDAEAFRQLEIKLANFGITTVQRQENYKLSRSKTGRPVSAYCRDGTTFVFESVVEGRYHMADVHSCFAGTDVNRLAEAFYAAAGVTPTTLGPGYLASID